MLFALLTLTVLIQTISAQCDPTVEPYKSLKDTLNLNISFDATGRVPCFSDGFTGSTATCCRHDELKAAIQKMTIQTKDQWQAYINAIDKYFVKAEGKMREFFNNYDLILKTFNGADYSIWKYLPIDIANKEQYEYLRDLYGDTRLRREEFGNASIQCYNYTVNHRAWGMCEMCRSYSSVYVASNSSSLFGKQSSLYAVTCEEAMEPCAVVYQMNYRLIASINLYLTFAHVRFGTSLPLVNPALYLEPEAVPTLMDSLVNCKNYSADSCTFPRQHLICNQLSTFFQVSPFSEGSLTAMNDLIKFLNSSDSLGTVPAQSAVPNFKVRFVNTIENSLLLRKADYQLLATSDTDPIFKDIKLDNSTINWKIKRGFIAQVCLMTVILLNLLFN